MIRYELRGRVIKGDGWGQRLGYPTANLTRHYFHYHPVSDGVYFGFVTLGAHELPSLAIVGVNKKIEVYVLNWRQNLYGRYLHMRIVKKIRPLRSFATASSLKEQIKKDIAITRRILRIK